MRGVGRRRLSCANDGSYLARVDEMRRRFYERSLKEVVMCE